MDEIGAGEHDAVDRNPNFELRIQSECNHSRVVDVRQRAHAVVDLFVAGLAGLGNAHTLLVAANLPWLLMLYSAIPVLPLRTINIGIGRES